MRRLLLVSALSLAACGQNADPGGGSGGGNNGAGGGDQPMDLPCDVAAFVSDKCTSCHGSPARNAAPFPLLTLANFTTMSPLVPGATIG